MVFMPHWPKPFNTNKPKINLEPMRVLLDALGNPHLKIPPTIHIAGTNGKGSTAAYLKAIFEDAGYKAHMYTSPHLLEFNERIVLAGCPIFDDYLFEICERVRTIYEKLNLDNSFFEITTAIAFIAFSETPADILILETGLGGRLDSTNIIPSPIATIITSISYDHMEALGPTLSNIAAEKAGIIKPNIPCIISPQVDDVYDMLFFKCEELDAPSFAYGYDYTITKNMDSFTVEGKDFCETFPFPKLAGDHQILNASTVIAAILSNAIKFNITRDNIQKGLETVSWPGRLQRIKCLGKDIIIDGAHNIGGAQALSIWLKENKHKPINMILGMTKNRDVATFTSYFKDIVDVIYCVRVMSEPSSYMNKALAGLIETNTMPTILCDNLEEAIILASKENAEVIVTGSLFLVADALKLCR